LEWNAIAGHPSNELLRNAPQVLLIAGTGSSFELSWQSLQARIIVEPKASDSNGSKYFSLETMCHSIASRNVNFFKISGQSARNL